jgi:hypothetical protein
MSLNSVKKYFEDNYSYLDSKNDPVMFNINAGLLDLVKTLDADLTHIRRQNDELMKLLKKG